MTDMPERIFATRAVNLNTCRAGTYRDIANDEKQRMEYIRADKVAALVEAAEFAITNAVADDQDEWFAQLRAALAALDAKP